MQYDLQRIQAKRISDICMRKSESIRIVMEKVNDALDQGITLNNILDALEHSIINPKDKKEVNWWDNM